MDLNLKRTGGSYFPSWQTLPVMGIMGGAVLGGIFSPQVGLMGSVVGFFVMLIIAFQREQERAVGQVKAEYEQKMTEKTIEVELRAIESVNIKVAEIEKTVAVLRRVQDAFAASKLEADRRERVEASETIGSAMIIKSLEANREGTANMFINPSGRSYYIAIPKFAETETKSASSDDDLTNED